MQQASPSQGLLPPPIRNKLAQAAQDALYIKRGELQDQLRDLTKRRAELQGQRAQMSATGGQAHDARIAVIDQRSAAIEKELFATNERATRPAIRVAVQALALPACWPSSFCGVLRKAFSQRIDGRPRFPTTQAS